MDKRVLILHADLRVFHCHCQTSQYLWIKYKYEFIWLSVTKSFWHAVISSDILEENKEKGYILQQKGKRNLSSSSHLHMDSLTLIIFTNITHSTKFSFY